MIGRIRIKQPAGEGNVPKRRDASPTAVKVACQLVDGPNAAYRYCDSFALCAPGQFMMGTLLMLFFGLPSMMRSL